MFNIFLIFQLHISTTLRNADGAESEMKNFHQWRTTVAHWCEQNPAENSSKPAASEIMLRKLTSEFQKQLRMYYLQPVRMLKCLTGKGLDTVGHLTGSFSPPASFTCWKPKGRPISLQIAGNIDICDTATGFLKKDIFSFNTLNFIRVLWHGHRGCAD